MTIVNIPNLKNPKPCPQKNTWEFGTLNLQLRWHGRTSLTRSGTRHSNQTKQTKQPQKKAHRRRRSSYRNTSTHSKASQTNRFVLEQALLSPRRRLHEAKSRASNQAQQALAQARKTAQLGRSQRGPERVVEKWAQGQVASEQQVQVLGNEFKPSGSQLELKLNNLIVLRITL